MWPEANSVRMVRSRRRLVGLAGALTLAVAGCGSQSRTGNATKAASNVCRTAQLTVRTGRTGAAAGSGGGSIVLNNVSRSTCSLEGYPTNLQMLNATGRPIPTIAERGPAMAMPPHLRVRAVTLTPDESARIYFGYTNPSDFIGFKGFAGCPTPARLRLTLPGNHTATTLKWRINGADETRGRLQCGEIALSPVTLAVKGWA
jgi:hypothetical protein